MGACAALVDALLDACAELRFLVTSRESVRVDGEAVYVLRPFPVAGSGSGPGRESPTADHDAVSLFVERARAVRSDFAVTDANRPAVREICRRLEGMPLAIELAARRTRALAPAEILAHLDDGDPEILRQDGRRVTARQRTPHDSAGWSHDLCTRLEQRLWASLSVFPGEFDLDAAAAIVGPDLDGSPLELMFALVDKSVLTVGPGPVRGRFRLPQAHRRYGLATLARHPGEAAALRRRHRDWYAAMAARATREAGGADWSGWLGRLRRDDANLHEALRFCAEAGEGRAGLTLAGSLHRFWLVDGRFAQGQRWLTRFLDQTDGDDRDRLDALHAAGWLATLHGDRDAAARLRHDGAALAATARPGLDRTGGRAGLDGLTGRDGPDGRRALVAQLAGLGALYAGSPGAAEVLEPALAAFRRDGNVDHQLRTLSLLMLAAAFGADPGRVERYQREWLSIAERLAAPQLRTYADWAYSIATWRGGDAARARKISCATLAAAADHDGGRPGELGVALQLDAAAWFESSLGEHTTAAVLLGAADRGWERMGTSTAALPGLFACRRRAETAARRAPGARAFEAAWARGTTLDLAEARACAVSGAGSPAVEPLTRRELEVAELLGRGLSNREIAAALVISPRTAESHVQQILNKLGMRSRARVAAWLAAQPIKAS
ncbi:LuxR C-terminal-related transcriptional regulator [Frankia sp. AgB32]|uniref:ATP-binding protein n=1 Tax=Frankia sp. AgB32 TaxID=631119 RepID=UPI00200C3372|nr:LuxR C-terminal-related transcriptional regulator [Frankia sp. AgB32]MCK9896617.1 LuxR C-terminal-related transcriptional regulator [Frankia sp. AgB32]